MDGYAVRARDTFGASDAVPAFLSVAGHVAMGEVFPGAVGPGQAVGVSTGGVLPDGADAVVMVEYTEEADGELAVQKGVASGEHVLRAGDDLRRGELLVARGRRLRPQDVGALAAFGLVDVPVHRRPVVGILSTGNEIVTARAALRPGQVRDVNAHALAAQVRRAGAEPRGYGIARDDEAELRARLVEMLDACDAVLLSGGSSVGVRDLTARVIADTGGELLFHGVSVRPGKPTILARAGGRPILGMPGVPVSALIIFEVFVRPLIRRLGGERLEVAAEWPARRRARLARRMASIAGREDYLRVRLVERDGATWAEPLLGGSASLATVVRADGLVVVPANVEGIAEGDEVEVRVYE